MRIYESQRTGPFICTYEVITGNCVDHDPGSNQMLMNIN